jgi:hypothetical protein
LRDQPGRRDYDNERLRDEVVWCKRVHTHTHCKVACRHGSSLSPSHAPSRPASSLREDPVAGPHQDTHPFPLRAAATPRSSVQPTDAPSASSHAIDAPGDAPVPPTPTAFASTPFSPFLPSLDASCGINFEAYTRYVFVVSVSVAGRPPWPTSLVLRTLFFTSPTLTTRAYYTPISLHDVVLGGGERLPDPNQRPDQ